MDAHQKQRFVALLLCVLCWKLVSAVDRTREDRAVGADIVQAVVDIIREKCIYPNDRVFLRRLAYVESKDGKNTNTFRPNYYGGIWQVEKSEFDSTKQCYGVEDMCQAIQEKLNIDWRAVAWTDLTKPLYSGLAASLRLQQIAGNNTPGVLERQADFWVNNYHKRQPALYFISEVNQIPENKRCEIDLAFILDGSGSITFLNFLRILDFVKNVTKQFEIGPDAVQVAAISFSDYARVEFGFGDYTSNAALDIAIDNIQYDAGGTNTAYGIRTARRGVFQRNTRTNAVKVGLVITDGYSNSYPSTVLEASYAKDAGIALFAIGIGDVNEMELNEVASDPNCTHVFFLTQFSEIDSLVYEIKKAACRAPITLVIDKNTTNTTTGPTSSTPVTHTKEIVQILKNTTKTDVFLPPPTDNTDTKMNVSVNCGIVHIYMSYDNPHPSPVLYSDKVTATDDHPAILYFNQTVDGRPLYLSFVGTKLPPEAAGLKNCSDAKYVIGIAKENKTDVEIVCRQNNVERECTKIDFELSEKYKHYICRTNGVLNTLIVANPCTATAIHNNEMYHPYPYDDTKFIKCDYQQKMYITQCPNGERYHQGSHSCGSTTTTITNDKTPLDPNLSNPCTAHALMNHQFFFTYTKDKTKFIHCDVWGHAWILNCPSNLVWSQQTQTCMEDTHSSSNPCTQDKLDQGITMFPLKDPHKYIHCDNGLNPWVQSCVGGTVFDYASQNCVWQSNSILG